MAHYKGAASEAGRAMHLMKKREKAQQEIEFRKKKIEEDLKIENIENKFATHYDAVEQQLKSSTIGLVTLDEMKAKQEHIIQALSFDMNEDEENDEEGESSDEKPEPSWRDKEEPILKKIRKNPDVDTSFLPDREREEADLKLREELRLEWVMTQASLKDEPITVTFNFSELKTVTADQLMYVKEDLILPHHYTFYDFIVTKARGKSGPLFQFDASDDIRLVNDASQEKQDSHAGKVLLRSWYERNKHIFPASRWEPYDPTKIYSKYTIKGK
ncbi:Uncharacterized protein OBRU01_23391 [Operophtera brumata]|uniref:Protein FAM50 homolog n=1 Tax=Operophtera brumata TaxID=104452 RepID=A0A0L7KNV4_OPEBR|nr:Uncharacterized protein OBRU01_23391 [Operophtera brumata]